MMQKVSQQKMSDKVEKLLQRLKKKQEDQLNLKLEKWDFDVIQPLRTLPTTTGEQEQCSKAFLVTQVLRGPIELFPDYEKVESEKIAVKITDLHA